MLKKFLIKKGNHYAFHFPKFHFGKKNEFEVRFIFNTGCKYDLGGDDNYDINKLWGVSFGLHHKNSFRIGWNSAGVDTNIISPHVMGDKSIALFCYIYNNGVRTYEQIGVINEENLGKWKVKFDFDNNRIALSNGFSDAAPKYFPFKFPKFKWGYYLFPYFGGNQEAPNDKIIYLAAL